MIMHSKSTGNKYQITFHKQSVQKKYKRPNGRRCRGTSVITTCQIRQFEWINIGFEAKPSRECGSGVSRQNPIDSYDHMVGKRIAMGRAIDNAALRDRTLRTEFYEALDVEFVIRLPALRGSHDTAKN